MEMCCGGLEGTAEEYFLRGEEDRSCCDFSQALSVVSASLCPFLLFNGNGNL